MVGAVERDVLATHGTREERQRRPAAVAGVSAELWPAAMPQRVAERYLSMGEDFLDDAPIPRCDLRKAGAKRPVKVWRRVDFDAFLEQRQVQPGRSSPWEQR